MAAQDPTRPLEAFEPARVHLRTATNARRELLDAWNSLREHDSFDVTVHTEMDGSCELRAFSDLTPEVVELLELQAKVFLTSVKAAMDGASCTAAETVCSPLWPVDADMHRMPLCTSRQQFDSLPP